MITIEDKNYPKLLKSVGKEAPKKLYYKGNWNEEIFENCLAVVGSRHLTSYGKRTAEQLVGEIATQGITIVSGFMYGGDAAAHRATLFVGGRTIAVMPCGIDLISPEYQKDLYNEILEKGGLIISEYEGDIQPLLWMYPKRNRIVAGLCRALLVIEAGLDSGTLITAEFAKKFGRKIFAVPGPITSEVSKGANKLIKEGAELVTSAKEILDYYRSNPEFSFALNPCLRGTHATQKIQSSRSLFSSLDYAEKRIIEELKIESMDADILARNIGIKAADLGSKLSLMQIKGIIKQEGNKYYVN